MTPCRVGEAAAAAFADAAYCKRGKAVVLTEKLRDRCPTLALLLSDLIRQRRRTKSSVLRRVDLGEVRMTGMVRAAVCGVIALGGSAAHAHGGGLNAEGCHNDRKRGGYHCHRGAGSASSSLGLSNGLVERAMVRPAARAGGDASYRNCSHARAVGAAPVQRGQPGYGPHLDRDGDGVGCE